MFSPNGILVVGGRLKFSSYNYEKRHPAILCRNHALSKIIVESEHRLLLHAGSQHMFASLRERLWIIGAPNICKCKCTKHVPKSNQPIMGKSPLLLYRAMKDEKLRGTNVFKCYVCQFICLSTKEVHIEVVSGLTADSFLQNLRWYISRPGKPTKLYLIMIQFYWSKKLNSVSYFVLASIASARQLIVQNIYRLLTCLLDCSWYLWIYNIINIMISLLLALCVLLC